MSNAPAPTFGSLLKQLRKRGGMTQRDLAAALGYSAWVCENPLAYQVLEEEQTVKVLRMWSRYE